MLGNSQVRPCRRVVRARARLTKPLSLEAQRAVHRAIGSWQERHRRRSTARTTDDGGVRLPTLSEAWRDAARPGLGLPLVTRLAARRTAAGWVTATLLREGLPLGVGEGESGTAIAAGQHGVTSRHARAP